MNSTDDSILITPEQQEREAAERASRQAERIRRAQEFSRSLTDDFDRELLLGKSRQENPYAGALLGASSQVTTPSPGPIRNSGSGYTGRDHAPSYGSVAHTLAKATAAIDQMTPED